MIPQGLDGESDPGLALRFSGSNPSVFRGQCVGSVMLLSDPMVKADLSLLKLVQGHCFLLQVVSPALSFDIAFRRYSFKALVSV